MWRICGGKRLKKRGNRLLGAISMLLGLCCALVMGGVFYGAMAYQLADGVQLTGQTAPQEAGALLALSGAEMLEEQTGILVCGGRECRVTTRTYALEDGLRAQAITATPAAYIEMLSEEGFAAQLITGFTLAGISAVYNVRGEEAILSAREGEWIFMIRAAADEQTMYALGTAAYLN